MAKQKTTPPPPTPSQLLLSAGQTFLSAFPVYIRLSFASAHFSADDPHRFAAFLRDTALRSLCTRLASSSQPALDVQIFPALFALGAAESRVSASLGQDRGSLLAGVRSSDAAAVVDPDEIRALAEPVDFISRVQRSAAFADMPAAPRVELAVVPCAELDDGLVADDGIMWPEALDAGAAADDDSSSSTLFFRMPPTTTSSAITADTEPDEHPPNPPSAAVPEPQPQPPAHGPQPKLRPVHDILARLRWDPALAPPADYSVVYLDRFTGYVDVPLPAWPADSSAQDFVPLHRVVAVRRLSTGRTLWWREGRRDLISAGGAGGGEGEGEGGEAGEGMGKYAPLR